MAVTDDERLARRMRQMSLHGLSQDAWDRYNGGAQWDYQIAAAGFKYNATDRAAAIGIHQLERAELMRRQREALARRYRETLAGSEQLEIPPAPPHRLHAWHLFPVRLRLDRLTIERNHFVGKLRGQGVGFSVHWRPLHLHPYYRDAFGWQANDCPVASEVWQRLVSLPLYPTLRDVDQEHIIHVIRSLCDEYATEDGHGAWRPKKPR